VDGKKVFFYIPVVRGEGGVGGFFHKPSFEKIGKGRGKEVKALFGLTLRVQTL